jgi:hypothetical protein
MVSRLILVVFLTVSCAAANAENRCEAPLDKYSGTEYGDVLTTLETDCVSALSPKQLLFTAGLAEALLEKCGLPRDLNSRYTLTTFLTSTLWVSIIGREYLNPDLGTGLRDQASSTVVYAAGQAALRVIGGCEGSIAPIVANGIVKYLDRTAAAAPRYVDGCARYYAGRYSREQCQCLADVGRSVFPDIYQTTFSPGSIRALIQRNPAVGLQVGLQCGISNY